MNMKNNTSRLTENNNNIDIKDNASKSNAANNKMDLIYYFLQLEYQILIYCIDKYKLYK